MPKVGMEPLRRRQAIEATMTCIHQEGVAAATLDGIARHAGVTKGLILHYFGDKDGLLAAVYQDLYQRLGKETLQRLHNATTPQDRLFAVLEAQVCDAMIEPKIVSTWFALGAKAPETPALARMERINSRRLVSNLIDSLKRIGVSHAEAVEIAEELLALIYGLWTNLANKTIETPEKARAILYRFTKVRMPQLETALPSRDD